MRRLATGAALLALLLGCAPGPAEAQIARRSGTFGGLALTWWVSYPDGYDPALGYPTVLVFGGGPQTLDGARRTLESDWQAEAAARGYVVVAPGTPDGRLFFQGADQVFPAFLDHLIDEFRPPDTRLHVAGHSNGGSSAFHVASLYPERVATVIGYPGLLNGQAARARMDALAPLCVFMHVGDSDASWRNAMRQQAEQMRARGVRVAMTVEPGQGHRLRAGELDLPRRLLDEIESCG